MSNLKTVTEQKTALQKACQAFLDGWQNYLNCINFQKSTLNADAIHWMNEVPGQIEQAVKKGKRE